MKVGPEKNVYRAESNINLCSKQGEVLALSSSL